MQSFVGTSGFSYKEWKGTFYPEKQAEKGMLAFYAARFLTVEINASFYRMPRAEMLAGWTEQVPQNFRFVLKAPRKVTHIGRLADASSLDYFLKASEALGARRGPILFQLPPFFRKDAERLRDFLRALPPGIQPVFEFRHASWFEEDVYALLQEHAAALCAGDVDEEGRSPPLVKTANFGYLRLRRENYTLAEIDEWALKITSQGWEQVYVFMKHEIKAPEYANQMIAALDARAVASPGEESA